MATDIEDTTHAVEAASVMRLLRTRPQVLALGEPTHGEETLLELRNELFQELVEREGYRTIAIESDCVSGLIVDDYVTSGAGTLDEVMERGFSHADLGLGTSAANRELVRWARTFNADRSPSEHVRFAGIDGPLEITHAASPRQALTSLHSYLAAHLVDTGLLPCTAKTLDHLLGDDGQWVDPAAMMDPARSVGQSGEAKELRLLADDLAALLDAQTPHLIAVTSRDDWDRARLYGRTATGLLRYHHWMADASPSRMARLVGLRDQMMAHNVLALAERGPTLVHAHNSHLQRDPSTMRMWDQPLLQWWSAGALVNSRLGEGEGYAFVATALGTLPHQGVDAPPPDTVEGLLYALPQDRCVIDAPRLASALGPTLPAPRVSAWFGYAPLDPAQLSRIDGLVFLGDVRRS
ncbi:erythromycin esterase family protein [Streptomyces sp. NPDC002853]